MTPMALFFLFDDLLLTFALSPSQELELCGPTTRLAHVPTMSLGPLSFSVPYLRFLQKKNFSFLILGDRFDLTPLMKV